MKTNVPSQLFFSLIRNYLLEFLPKTRNLSPCTVKAARDSINLLLDFCTNEQHIPLLQIHIETAGAMETIKGFVIWLEEKRNCSNSTINHRLSCIRSFFRYAAYEDALFVSMYQSMLSVPLRKITKDKTIDFLSENAMRVLLSTPDVYTLKGLRDAFYMSLMYDSGARNSEMISLKICDIVDTSTPYMLVNGKGRKKRCIPLMVRTMELYHRYLRKYFDAGAHPNDSLFYTIHNGKRFPMSVDNVAKFITKYAEMAKEKCDEILMHVHPHMFRRSRAMHLYRNGMPLVLLSEFLGHDNPETTLIYASADTEMKRQAIEKASNHLVNTDFLTKEPLWSSDDEMIRKLYGLK